MKTVKEMVEASVQVPFKLHEGSMIYQHSVDVDAMGMAVYKKEEDENTFLYKDPDFTKPVTDEELLSLWFNNTVVFKTKDDGSLELEQLFELNPIQLKEYKHDDFSLKFCTSNGYYAGEVYEKLMAQAKAEEEEEKPSGGEAAVGTATVGTATVA